MGIQSKYVSISTVAARVARNHKGLVFDTADVAEWCFEAIKNIGNYDAFVEKRGVVIDVNNLEAVMPCDMYRLLYVRNNANNCKIPEFINQGDFIRFSSKTAPAKINIDYIAFATDEDGYPMIEDTSQEACFWYVLSKLLLEDYLNGKIPENRYQFIEQKYRQSVSKAKGTNRWMSRNDMEEFTRISMNMVRSIRYPANGTGHTNDTL